MIKLAWTLPLSSPSDSDRRPTRFCCSHLAVYLVSQMASSRRPTSEPAATRIPHPYRRDKSERRKVSDQRCRRRISFVAGKVECQCSQNTSSRNHPKYSCTDLQGSTDRHPHFLRVCCLSLSTF